MYQDGELSQYQLLENILIENGIKITLQRQLILKELIDSNKHMKVEDIHENIKSYGIGIATIYRNVKVFVELGILKEFIINGVSYYEIKMFNKKQFHIHFKCTGCGKIIDINETKINVEYIKLNNKIEEKFNLKVLDSNIMLSGLCSNCTKKKNKKNSKIN